MRIASNRQRRDELMVSIETAQEQPTDVPLGLPTSAITARLPSTERLACRREMWG
jgi:hypothetical protein